MVNPVNNGRHLNPEFPELEKISKILQKKLNITSTKTKDIKLPILAMVGQCK